MSDLRYQRSLIGNIRLSTSAFRLPPFNFQLSTFNFRLSTFDILSKAEDGLLVVVFNPTRGLYEIREDAAQRSDTSYTLALPVAWTGETVHIYVSFISEDAKKCANSLYMGAQVLL
ncbi:MAG TPA: DUF6266 family protein [Flavobacterium sp.]|jgi:hypothetical protein